MPAGINHTLEIIDVVPGDAGKYTCIASNVQGKEKCTVTLTVKEKGVSDFRSVLKSK